MEAYSYLAKYYDILMNDFDYDGYFSFIKKYITGNGIDLCCGSGIMTSKLASISNNVIGVDISKEMLNEAMQKKHNNIIYINDDISLFKSKEQKDFVTCVCDGFNYLSIKKIEKAIKNISLYLKKDGYLIFDISSEYKLKTIIGNNLFIEDYEDLTYIWFNELKNKSLYMQLSFFEKQCNGLYKRIDEDHTQYIHSKQDIKNLLKDKFDFKIFDGITYKKVTNKTQRLLFVCKRK